MTSNDQPYVDRQQLELAAKYLGACVEVRAFNVVTPKGSQIKIASGTFDNPSKLVGMVSQFADASAVYVSLNEVDPARATNRIRHATTATSAKDIVRRNGLLIDVDAVRHCEQSGVSSTTEEHAAAIELAECVAEYLTDLMGFPQPLLINSGNGAHLIYAIDLPTDDGGLVKRVLYALASIFATNANAKIDTAVHDAARITKLPGTMVRKGPNTPDRPHRMSRIISAPETLEVVDLAKLEMVAASAPPEPERVEQPASPNAGNRPGDVFENSVEWDHPLVLGGDWPSGQWTIGEPQSDGTRHVTRPGKSPDDGTSGTIGGCAKENGERLYIFSTADEIAPLPSGKALSKFAVFALRYHNGNHLDAARALLEMGYRGERMVDFDAIKETDSPASIINVVEADDESHDDAYVAFPLKHLPPVMGDYIGQCSASIVCDPSYVAAAHFCSYTPAIGAKRKIRLKGGMNPWDEPPIFWAAIVGKSGTRKSPAFDAGLHELIRQDQIAAELDKVAQKEYEKAKEKYDAAKKSGDPWAKKPKKPTANQFVTNDATIEALAEILADQKDRNGVVYAVDELDAWLNFDQYKNTGARARWLSAFGGRPWRINRKTGDRKLITVPRAAISVVGGIQPALFRDAMNGTNMVTGLMARLLIAMPPFKETRWNENEVSPFAAASLDRVFDKILELQWDLDDQLEPQTLAMPLSPEAKELWVSRYNSHQEEMRDMDDHLTAAWSKLEAYTARFALIFELCDWAMGVGSDAIVNLKSIERAIAIVDWFGNEQKRVLRQHSETDEQRDLRELYELIAKRPGKTISATQLRGLSRKYRTAGVAENMLQNLVKQGRGGWDTVETGARPATFFKIRPPKKETEK